MFAFVGVFTVRVGAVQLDISVSQIIRTSSLLSHARICNGVGCSVEEYN